MGTPPKRSGADARHRRASRVALRARRCRRDRSPPALAEADHAQVSADRQTVIVSARASRRATLVELVRWIDQHGVELADVQLKRPSLEDVFIELTGKSLRE